MGTCNAPGEAMCLGWGRGDGNCKKWVSRFGYVLKIELSGFADRLEMGFRERGNQA